MRPDPLTAGHVHMLRTVAMSERPPARRIAPGRRVVDGAGVALALLLMAVVLAGAVGVAWGLHVAGLVP